MKDKKYSALDEWVRRAGEGDQTAREMLLMSFKPLIYKQAAKYRHHHDSLEDAVQYGGVVLLEAAADYRAGSSQPFPACATALPTRAAERPEAAGWRQGRFCRRTKPSQTRAPRPRNACLTRCLTVAPGFGPWWTPCRQSGLRCCACTTMAAKA